LRKHRGGKTVRQSHVEVAAEGGNFKTVGLRPDFLFTEGKDWSLKNVFVRAKHGDRGEGTT